MHIEIGRAAVEAVESARTAGKTGTSVERQEEEQRREQQGEQPKKKKKKKRSAAKQERMRAKAARKYGGAQ